MKHFDAIQIFSSADKIGTDIDKEESQAAEDVKGYQSKSSDVRQVPLNSADKIGTSVEKEEIASLQDYASKSKEKNETLKRGKDVRDEQGE